MPCPPFCALASPFFNSCFTFCGFTDPFWTGCDACGGGGGTGDGEAELVVEEGERVVEVEWRRCSGVFGLCRGDATWLVRWF